MDGEQKILLSAGKRTICGITDYVHLDAERQCIKCIMLLQLDCA